MLENREKEAMSLAIEGFSNAAIGDRLGISPRTVEHYRASVMEKMQARNLSDLVRTSMLIDLNRDHGEGVPAGSNELKAAVTLNDAATKAVVTVFDVSGESAAHPLSSENGMDDAIREAATKIVSALQ